MNQIPALDVNFSPHYLNVNFSPRSLNGNFSPYFLDANFSPQHPDALYAPLLETSTTTLTGVTLYSYYLVCET